MSSLSIGFDLLVSLGLVFGLGLPWAVRFAALDPTEKIATAALFGVLQLYALGGIVYVARLDPACFFAAPLIAIAGVIWQRQALRALWRHRDARAWTGWLLVFAGWLLGIHALIHSYSGGEWSADWLEHYQRALFFLDRGPIDQVFNGIYPLPARPPLTNIVSGTLLHFCGTGFAHYQIVSTLLSALVLLPVLLLKRTLGATHTPDAFIVALLMFSPIVVQNGTFPWTKLPCAALVLTSVAFYVPGLQDASPLRRHLALVAMAAAVLSHYSAAPYALALAAWHVVWLWRQKASQRRTNEMVAGAALAGGLLASWFVWAGMQFGAAGTFLSNSTASADAAEPWFSRVLIRVHALWVTLVPHPLRGAPDWAIAQHSSLGYLRDYCFNIYQTTLPGALGISGVVLLLARIRFFTSSPASRGPGAFWGLFIVLSFALSLAAISWRDRWGVVHIGMIPLLLLGLVWLSAAWPTLSTRWRAGWLLALAIDSAAGIGLQVYLQATARVTSQDAAALLRHEVATFSPVATKNAVLKEIAQLRFLADSGPPPLLIVALLAVLGCLVWQAALPRTRSPLV